MNFHRFGWVCLVLLGVVLVPAISSAQEPPSQYEHVKGLEPFIGFWASDAPDDGGLAIMSRWAANKSYGQFNIWMRNADERTHVGTINIGWDGADQKLAMWAFFPDMQAKAHPTIDGGKMTWTSEGTTSEGEKTSGDVTFEVDGETLTIQVRNSRRGDAAQPNMDLTLTRRQRGER